MVEGARIFTPLKLDKGRNVGIYGKGDALVASGLVWGDARPQYASKAFLMHQPLGEGHVIAFAEDPNYRAFTEATSLLFINAVLLGPRRTVERCATLRAPASGATGLLTIARLSRQCSPRGDASTAHDSQASSAGGRRGRVAANPATRPWRSEAGCARGPVDRA